MLSMQSYIESDKLLYQLGELRPGFLDKDTSLLKGPSTDSSLCIGYDSVEDNEDSFKLVERIDNKTGEKLFIVE